MEVVDAEWTPGKSGGVTYLHVHIISHFNVIAF